MAKAGMAVPTVRSLSLLALVFSSIPDPQRLLLWYRVHETVKNLLRASEDMDKCFIMAGIVGTLPLQGQVTWPQT